MGEPPLVGWLLTALGTTTGVLCLLRSRAGAAADPYKRRTTRAEGAMGIGMALMAAPALAHRTGAWGPMALGVLFTALAVRVVLFAHGESHRLHHTVDAAAMAYMAVLMALAAGGSTRGTMAGMHDGGHATMGPSLVNLTLLGYYIIYVLWSGVRLVPAATVGCATAPTVPGRPVRARSSVWQASEVGRACRLSLAIGMLAMVLGM
ncbi:DUF5134 domain-containing protein [Streptomyces sp. NPDC101225]|uniref:DUF5134 domain-containing protein n=1 Tax=Streptomyces sp. NPDC101225 TaxID=3366135 RepID=UPI0038166CE7